MNVDELRKAIANLHGNLRVEIVLPNDEVPATCLTKDARYLRLRLDSTEISVGETVLHEDAPT